MSLAQDLTALSALQPAQRRSVAEAEAAGRKYLTGTPGEQRAERRFISRGPGISVTKKQGISAQSPARTSGRCLGCLPSTMPSPYNVSGLTTGPSNLPGGRTAPPTAVVPRVYLGGTQAGGHGGRGCPNKAGDDPASLCWDSKKVANTLRASNCGPGSGIKALPISFQPQNSQWRLTCLLSPLHKGNGYRD